MTMKINCEKGRPSSKFLFLTQHSIENFISFYAANLNSKYSKIVFYQIFVKNSKMKISLYFILNFRFYYIYWWNVDIDANLTLHNSFRLYLSYIYLYHSPQSKKIKEQAYKRTQLNQINLRFHWDSKFWNTKN